MTPTSRSILPCLLCTALWAVHVPAYEAPFRNITASVATNGFELEIDLAVFDPDRQQTRLGLHRYTGNAADHWRLLELATAAGVARWRVRRDGLNAIQDTEVGCALYDPARGVWKIGTWRYEGSLLQQWTTRNLSSSETLVAWLAEMGGTGHFRDTEIAYATYDPARGGWVKADRYYEGSTLHFQAPSNLMLVGRVVAWRANPFGTSAVYDRQIGYATFDAASGLWAEGEYALAGTALRHWITSGLVVRNGLVAWKSESVGTLSDFDVDIGYAIYNPDRRLWQRSAQRYDGRELSPWIVSEPAITDHVVDWSAERGNTLLNERRGFDYVTRTWTSSPTSPLAAFGQSTVLGSPPLGVWFSDQSLGVSSWEWDFGDGTGTADQHPYHRYTNAGIYTVTLRIDGPQGTDDHAFLLTVSSNAFPLAFVPSSVGLSGSSFRVFLTGIPPGTSVIIDASSNLVDWLPLLTNSIGAATLELMDSLQPPRARRFYRARVP